MRLIRPGDMVVPRRRFALHSRQVGLVVGDINGVEGDWLVMWVMPDRIQFTAHLDNALMVIDASTVIKAKERTRLLT